MTNDWLNCTASLEQFPYFADALLFVADENFDIFGMMVFAESPNPPWHVWTNACQALNLLNRGWDLTAEEIIDMSGSITTIQMQQTVESRWLNSELSAADDLSR